MTFLLQKIFQLPPVVSGKGSVRLIRDLINLQQSTGLKHEMEEM